MKAEADLEIRRRAASKELPEFANPRMPTQGQQTLYQSQT